LRKAENDVEAQKNRRQLIGEVRITDVLYVLESLSVLLIIACSFGLLAVVPDV
jgi:hypothetical protein